MIKELVGVALVVCSLTPWCRAQAWPQFRGPDGQGHAQTEGLPLTWSEEENVAWKTPLPGRGWSSPVVDDGLIWITAALNEGHSLRAVGVEFATGRMRHDLEVIRPDKPPAINNKNTYASPTPVIEPGRLYVHYGAMGTGCVDTRNGRVLWVNTQLVVDHKEGPGSSLVLWGDLVIFHLDGIDEQYVAALNKYTGQVVWKAQRPEPLPENPDFRKAYCTPLVVRQDGRDLLVSPGADRVIAYDPATGAPQWQVNYQGFSNVPRPVAAEGMVFVCTGYMKPQLWAIKLAGARGDATETNVVWKATKQVPANPSPVIAGQRLYMVSDQGVATCLDIADGDEKWTRRLGGGFWASPIVADGKIWFFGEEGVTTVIGPGDEFQRLAENRLDGQIMATPAAVDHAWVIRTDTHLYRIGSR